MVSFPEGRTNKNGTILIIGRFDAVNAARYFAENARVMTLLSASTNRQLPLRTGEHSNALSQSGITTSIVYMRLPVVRGLPLP